MAVRATKGWKTRGCAIVAALGVCALGCGPAVHNEVAERARQWFHEQQGKPGADRVAFYRDMLDRHPESLQAGVAFPDWGYGCLSMDDQAEAAHWTPFLEYGVEYLAGKYEKPYGERAQQLVSFLFGIASHQVADEQWHSLAGLREGIMEVLANSTFNGEFSRAHDTLDVGGDFALAHMNDLGYMLDKWTVPVDDVIEIYKSMGLAVPKWKLNICITRQFYAMEAVKRFGQGLFPSYASRAPMLTERIEDYYIGGLFAMATTTSDCWYSLIDWFDTGNFSKKCMVSDRRRQHVPGSRRKPPAPSFLDRIMPHLADQRWIQDLNRTTTALEREGVLHLVASTGGVSHLPSAARKGYSAHNGGRQRGFAAQAERFSAQRQNQGAKERTRIKIADKCAELTTLYPKAKHLYSLSAYSGFGTALAMGDFSGDGRTSVAISAPYYKTRSAKEDSSIGAVFVLEDPDLFYAFSQQNVVDADPLILTPAASAGEEPEAGTVRYSLFGSSMAVVDFNADGIDDLVVGSSGYGRDATGAMLGRVDVYLGHAGSGLSAVPDFSLTAKQLALYTDSPWSHQRIGGFLYGEDLNNDGFVDLVIGAPYHSDLPYELHSGRVFGYISKQGRSSSGQMGPPDFSLASPKRHAFEWFGFAAKAVYLRDFGTTLLLVGAPGHKAHDAASNHTLAGKVYAFVIPNNTRAPPVYEGLEFTSMKEATQLGSQIHLWEVDDAGEPGSLPIVLFGSPSEQNTAIAQHLSHGVLDSLVNQAPERGWQAGEVRVIDPVHWVRQTHQPSEHHELGSASSGGSSDGDDKERFAGLLSTLRGVQSPGHFGRSLATTGSEVWIGEPLSDLEDGRVYRWRPDFERPECLYVPSAMGRARFGHQIKIAKRGGKELLAVSMPHDSQFSRLTGSVLLLQK
ncbi:hypothetical protein GQ54DRAFT_262987 [Martensiomyces pterosporus]|nr:hypothetical protein GQ54DRAFT_262987 [Martensiomyces pterosporus]